MMMISAYHFLLSAAQSGSCWKLRVGRSGRLDGGHDWSKSFPCSHNTSSGSPHHNLFRASASYHRPGTQTPTNPPDEQAYSPRSQRKSETRTNRQTELVRFALRVSHFPSPLLLFFLVVSTTSTTLFRLTKTQPLSLSHHPIPIPLAPHS
jgi:hypothetical protein